jgi:uncharacterized protein YdhG (YjbR/CyaY superfamily)
VKKAKVRRRGSSAKGRKPRRVPQDCEEYFGNVPAAARGALQKMRGAIRSVVPKEATEVISYGIPAFKTSKVLVWYAAFTDHCSLFPTAAVIAQFKADLKPYSTSKGTIHFSLEKPIPAPLIRRIVRARLSQVTAER